jgi:hypothetical protein
LYVSQDDPVSTEIPLDDPPTGAEMKVRQHQIWKFLLFKELSHEIEINYKWYNSTEPK